MQLHKSEVDGKSKMDDRSKMDNEKAKMSEGATEGSFLQPRRGVTRFR